MPQFHLHGLVPLNTEYVKQEAINRYSEIHHPTLVDICWAIVVMQRLYGRENVVVCKEDVRGYFTLCNFPPWAVRLMAFAVHSTNPQVEGSVYFSTHGNFGSTIMPFVYEVFTRILRLTIIY